MNFFDTPIDSTATPDAVALKTVQQPLDAPVSGLPQAVVSVSNYLGGPAILLILAAMVGVAAQAAGLKRKSRRSSQIEMLERIWKMSPQKIKE